MRIRYAGGEGEFGRYAGVERYFHSEVGLQCEFMGGEYTLGGSIIWYGDYESLGFPGYDD
jgi:hypothetical protein